MSVYFIFNAATALGQGPRQALEELDGRDRSILKFGQSVICVQQESESMAEAGVASGGFR